MIIVLKIGDFKDTQVLLNRNQLTTFEESVFGTMLQQMTKGEGFIKATQSKTTTQNYVI